MVCRGEKIAYTLVYPLDQIRSSTAPWVQIYKFIVVLGQAKETQLYSLHF